MDVLPKEFERLQSSLKRNQIGPLLFKPVSQSSNQSTIKNLLSFHIELFKTFEESIINMSISKLRSINQNFLQQIQYINTQNDERSDIYNKLGKTDYSLIQTNGNTIQTDCPKEKEMQILLQRYFSKKWLIKIQS